MASEIKPVGWFNPWNDYHGYQQVAQEFEGKGDAVPLYSEAAITRLREANKALEAAYGTAVQFAEQAERERDLAREYGREARHRENLAGNARIHEQTLRQFAEAKLAKVEAESGTWHKLYRQALRREKYTTDDRDRLAAQVKVAKEAMRKAKAFHDRDEGLNGFTADYEILRLEIDSALASLDTVSDPVAASQVQQ